MSSDERESRASSPVAVPTSSPLRSSPLTIPHSSPEVQYVSSSSGSSSSDGFQPPRKRFSEHGVSRLASYWPPKRDHSSEPESSTSATGSSNEGQDDANQLSDSSAISLSSSSEEESSDSSSEAESDSSDSDHAGGYVSTSSSDASSSDRSTRSAESDNEDVLKVWDGLECTELTVDEGILSLMEIFLKHVNKKTVGSILKCVLKFIPETNNMPQSQYSLFQYVYNLCPLPQETIHFYCKKCQYYLDHIDRYAIERERRSKDGYYFDICDGSAYKKVCSSGKYDLTLMGHLDGVGISESSDSSLWPLEYFICELSPNLRFKYLLVNGVWLDDSKPNFNTYYGPSAEEGAKLHSDGISWVHPRTMTANVSHVTIPGFDVDGPVRAQVQNIQSIGGKHCCNTCEQKMLKLPAEPVLPGVKKKKRKHVFAFSENPAKLRTSERMKAEGKVTLGRKFVAQGGKFAPKKGVSGPSVVSKLPKCDRSTAVFAEYMHLLLGIVKQFFELWFESDKNLPYSLRNSRDAINTFLLSIRVPDYITRIPRSTDSYSKWKANELRSFLLYYSLIILSQHMEEPYFKHWMLFVCSIQLLLQEEISDNDVTKAEIMLRLFIRNFGPLYKPDVLTYNLHSLIHLAITVRRWGNFKFISAFQFENFNGCLARCIHGSTNQGKELINNVRLMCAIGVLRARIESNSSTAGSRVGLRNKINSHIVTPQQQILLSNLGEVADSFYLRAAIGSEVYTSSGYRRQVKRNNFTVCYVGSGEKVMYGIVECFVKCGSGDFAFISVLKIDHMRYFVNEEMGVVAKHVIPVNDENDTTELIPVQKIVSKVIRVGRFVVLRPNTYEVNL